MQAIYDFFINTGKTWGLWDFFRKAGTWGTFFLFIAAGLIIIALSILVLYAVSKIPNKPTRIILFIVMLGIVVFGAFITVNLCIQTIDRLGALV